MPSPKIKQFGGVKIENKASAEMHYIPFDSYPDLLTVNELQTALGIGRNIAYQYIHNGEIRSIKIGRKIRIPKRYLIDFVYRECYNEPVTSGLSAIKEGSHDR